MPRRRRINEKELKELLEKDHFTSDEEADQPAAKTDGNGQGPQIPTEPSNAPAQQSEKEKTHDGALVGPEQVAHKPTSNTSSESTKSKKHDVRRRKRKIVIYEDSDDSSSDEAATVVRHKKESKSRESKTQTRHETPSGNYVIPEHEMGPPRGGYAGPMHPQAAGYYGHPPHMGYPPQYGSYYTSGGDGGGRGPPQAMDGGPPGWGNRPGPPQQMAGAPAPAPAPSSSKGGDLMSMLR